MQKLGHYRIDSQLGKGAMGVVYRATDERLDRTVALKVLRLNLSDEERAEYAARLQQEAKSAARLNHPGIITMFDCGDADGYAFLAMEYVEGKSLQTLMDGGVRLSIGRIQKVADQLFSALAYAHEHDVVHRDIKPANLMLTADGRLKITDFGIAQLPASDLTRPGALIGSPRHMAPEQVEGKKVDGRADIFSAGIVLYELLTGRKPFDGEHVASIAYKILHEPVDDIRMINPDVSEALASLVMRCLEKKPEQRFQTARDARAALRLIAGKSKDEATPSTTPSAEDSGPLVEPPKPAERKPVWMWVAAGACILFGGVTIYALQAKTTEAAHPLSRQRRPLRRPRSMRQPRQCRWLRRRSGPPCRIPSPR
ncbi:MAG: serine/threonine protein kinase [Burkholderiaceae bacterium]|nr:serine/threonine protein kinase [Burkholderiaceae bacterium]